MSATDSEKYNYSDTRLYLFEVPKEKMTTENNKTKLEKGCTYIDGCLKADKRDVYVFSNLKPIQYALIVEVDWKILTSEKVFSLNSYGNKELEFAENFDISISEILISACDSIFDKYKNIPDKIKETDIKCMHKEVIEGVTRKHLSADFGYDFFEYKNTNADIRYFETFTFPKDQGL